MQTVIKAKQEDEIHIYDVNGQKRTLSHEILYRYLICGWAFYVVAMLCNIFFYAVHPSEVDFDQWDDKFKVQCCREFCNIGKVVGFFVG